MFVMVFMTFIVPLRFRMIVHMIMPMIVLAHMIVRMIMRAIVAGGVVTMNVVLA